MRGGKASRRGSADIFLPRKAKRPEDSFPLAFFNGRSCERIDYSVNTPVADNTLVLDFEAVRFFNVYDWFIENDHAGDCVFTLNAGRFNVVPVNVFFCRRILCPIDPTVDTIIAARSIIKACYIAESG